MTIEKVKELAKEKLNLDITDEQAAEWLAEHQNKMLSDEELDNVSGGSCSGFGNRVVNTMEDITNTVLDGTVRPSGNKTYPTYTIPDLYNKE